jgi:hypothetical protein
VNFDFFINQPPFEAGFSPNLSHSAWIRIQGDAHAASGGPIFRTLPEFIENDEAFSMAIFTMGARSDTVSLGRRLLAGMLDF